jgi:hypothetical protein
MKYLRLVGEGKVVVCYYPVSLPKSVSDFSVTLAKPLYTAPALFDLVDDPEPRFGLQGLKLKYLRLLDHGMVVVGSYRVGLPESVSNFAVPLDNPIYMALTQVDLVDVDEPPVGVQLPKEVSTETKKRRTGGDS